MASSSVHLFALCVLAAATSVLTPATASADPPVAPATPQGKWERLGERQVDAKLDHDAITVGRDDGIFTAIQVKVEGSSLAMFEIKVTFGNGETFEPNTRLVFDQNTKSRIIDLPGNKRVIKRVDFKYANLPGGGKARVELWGRDAAPPPPAWQRIGERQVDAKLDHDTLTVDDAAYTALQIKVEGSSLMMFDVKVTFGNGEKFEPNVRLVFDQNTKSRVIDLPGNKRGIKRVDFRYANLPGGGKARVELWGKT
jgi:hypothetical protein